MKRIGIALFVLFIISCHPGNVLDRQKLACIPVALDSVYFPSAELEELFMEVQLSEIFPDSKTFVDCEARFSIDSILHWYRKSATRSGFELMPFIDSCFSCPEILSHVDTVSLQSDLPDHLHKHWNYLTRRPDATGLRSSLLSLNSEYVVPGGRFREIYYWDSYFTMEGLAASNQTGLIESMLDNFACLIEQYGHIPNGNRSYYLSRSQPPFFAEMVKLYAGLEGDLAVLKYLPALQMEYDFWMKTEAGKLYKRTVEIQGSVLNRYWDDDPSPRPESFLEDHHLASGMDSSEQVDLFRNIRAACESGWDFSSRWLADETKLESIVTTDILPADLNCLMYNMEATLARLHQLKEVPDLAAKYLKLAELRKSKISELFWNDSLNFFVDYNWKEGTKMTKLTLAAVYPLYFEIASAAQAEKMAEVLEKEFLKSGGLVCSLKKSGQQWDAPNGWAPLQWLAIVGLEKYGYSSLAETIGTRWLSLNKQVYESSGKMMEKYNVEDLSRKAGGGEYPLQDGFGWTNGVYLALIKRGYSSRKAN